MQIRGRFFKKNISIFFFLVFILFSCSSSKIAQENQQLRSKIMDLEHRVYELSDSPNHLLEEVLHDANLLMTIPSEENLNLALDLIQTYKSNFPKNENLYKLEQKKDEINNLFASLNSTSFGAEKNKKIFSNDKDVNETSPKLLISAQITEKKSGFITVQVRIQNLTKDNITNLWLKATLYDKNDDSYGITQDFFFNQLRPFDQETESLSWEYVRMEHIKSIHFSQMRYSDRRQNTPIKQGECSIGQGNVKIFIDY